MKFWPLNPYYKRYLIEKLDLAESFSEAPTSKL